MKKSFFSEMSSVSDGNLSYFFNGQPANKKQVLENRNKFFYKIGVDINRTVGIWVEGEDRVMVADAKQAGISMSDKEHAVRCDALITNKKNLYLFLLIADCLPVILFDPKNNALAIIHVGWKGAHLEIAKKTVQKMKDVFRTKPEDIIVEFGPSARADSFIKTNPSQKDDLRWRDFLIQVGQDKYKVDVFGFCKKQLRESGILSKNMHDCKIDTISDKRFFSHYRQNTLPHSDQGRFAVVVGLK